MNLDTMSDAEWTMLMLGRVADKLAMVSLPYHRSFSDPDYADIIRRRTG